MKNCEREDEKRRRHDKERQAKRSTVRGARGAEKLEKLEPHPETLVNKLL